MGITAKLFLKTGKIDSVRRFHPWVFSGALKRMEGNPLDGDLVEVYTNHDEYLATGHYASGSIMVRLFSWEQGPIERAFWMDKFQRAFDYRASLGLTESEHTNAYRLIHAEGDQLPGLICDYYDGSIVLEFHSAGMERLADVFADCLRELYHGQLKSIYAISRGAAGKSSRYLLGSPVLGSAVVKENNNSFLVNWVEGQKTGFFLDQRENRRWVGMEAKGKKVLNMFCYTGGFSVYALQGGAELVHSVDSSAKAMEVCSKNIEINGYDPAIHQCFVSDAIEFLQNIPDGFYDMIVLDPPAYAKHADARHNAIQGYRRLNEIALLKIKDGGHLFTFSCSQVVDRNHFNSAVLSAAIHSCREVKIVRQLSQAPCHPQSIYHVEGFYLKGLQLFVS